MFELFPKSTEFKRQGWVERYFIIEIIICLTVRERDLERHDENYYIIYYMLYNQIVHMFEWKQL